MGQNKFGERGGGRGTSGPLPVTYKFVNTLYPKTNNK